MTPPRSLIALCVVAGTALAGCLDGTSTGPLATGVVQETNVPDEQGAGCQLAHHYRAETTRSCNGHAVRIDVCAEAPVCDAAVAALVADVTACSEPASPFELDLTACAP